MKSSAILRPIHIAAAAALCLCAPIALHAQSKPGWGENQAQALEKAKTANKLVVLDFTGSDWCSWCKKMDTEVFSTPEFREYAQQHLELVEVDFPHQKSLPADLKKQNDELQKQYGIQGFPTIVVLNADGKKVGEFEGYQEGGAKAFIDQLEKLPKS
jgi:thioredoxin-related protein